jgi:type II secretory pathway component GspD/PulD (secretin)
MKSPNGKLTSMVDGNRVEAMDTVANLREMYSALKQEQSIQNQQRPWKKFNLRYARAEDVRDELQALVGGEVKSVGRAPQSPEESQRAMMMRAMMQQQQQQQQQQGQQGQPPAGPPAAKIPTAFVVNPRENSILVTAPPDKMAIIKQVIEAVDVRGDRDAMADAKQTQVYRLMGIEPEPVVKALEEIGHLSPTAHLEVDKKNKLIIADASPADQATIRGLVEKLSGSERSFDVRRLRHRRAEAVAASVEFMMGVDSKKKKTENHHWGWSPWDDDDSSTNKDKTNEFRVGADVEHNQLLLWANKIEIQQVEELLAKLGEGPVNRGDDRMKRVTIDGGSVQETKALLERIRAEWPMVAPNPLSSPLPASSKGKADKPLESSPEAELSTPPSKTTSLPPKGTMVRLTDFRRGTPAEEGIDAPSKAVDGTAAPVDVRVAPDGKIVVSSKDAQALDLFEELAAELATPRKEYTVFRLHHASAFSVSLNLEDFFKEEPKKDKVRLPDYIRYEYGIEDSDLQSSGDEGQGLSKRRKLKFLADSDANIILVSGATASQLKTIDELVKLYDQKPPPDSETSRQTDIFYLRHSKARAVAETVKEVFRDLLSENDKALNNNQQRGERRRFSPFGYEESGGDGESGQKTPKFKGSLSIGIDEASNALVVSAPTYVFRDVTKMIKDLDKVAEENNTVRVLKVSHGVTPERLREIIEAIQGRGSSGGAAKTATPPHQPSPKRGQKPSGNGGGTAPGQPSSGE